MFPIFCPIDLLDFVLIYITSGYQKHPDTSEISTERNFRKLHILIWTKIIMRNQEISRNGPESPTLDPHRYLIDIDVGRLYIVLRSSCRVMRLRDCRRSSSQNECICIFSNYLPDKSVLSCDAIH